MANNINITAITQKLDSGGFDLNYTDMQWLIDKVKTATTTLSRIAMVSNAVCESESSMKCALNTIKDLTNDFTRNPNGS